MFTECNSLAGHAMISTIMPLYKGHAIKLEEMQRNDNYFSPIQITIPRCIIGWWEKN
jgi:hypothetical protein